MSCEWILVNSTFVIPLSVNFCIKVKPYNLFSICMVRLIKCFNFLRKIDGTIRTNKQVIFDKGYRLNFTILVVKTFFQLNITWFGGFLGISILCDTARFFHIFVFFASVIYFVSSVTIPYSGNRHSLPCFSVVKWFWHITWGAKMLELTFWA